MERHDPTGTGTTIGDGTGVITILNDDAPPPDIQIYDVSDATGVEGDTAATSMTFTITRSGKIDVPSTIHPWTRSVLPPWTIGSIASQDVDYTGIPSSNAVSFAAGETTKTVTVQIKPDLIDEPDEIFQLVLDSQGVGETDFGFVRGGPEHGLDRPLGNR